MSNRHSIQVPPEVGKPPPADPSIATAGEPLLDTPPREEPVVLADGPGQAPRRRHLYLRLPIKLLLVALFSFGWAGLSVWLALPWIQELSHSITLPGAIAVIAGIAIVPGYLNANLVSSLLIDRPPPLRFDLQFPAITVLLACFNEEQNIEATLDYLCAQDYPGDLHILVADDGSTDQTAELARQRALRDRRISVLEVPHGGKARALNAALAEVETPLVATDDADTLLMPSALRRAVARLLVSPPDTVAVAGAVFVRNSRQNFFTRAQEWDYFLGIASVKRQQGLFQGTMVAQGAFSVYRAEALKGARGWPDRIGEDIVLTWAMMRRGGRIGYERTAIAFTGAPHDMRHLARQRSRWARGMIEGLREHGGALLAGRRSLAHAVLVDFAFPYLDVMYAVVFPIGIVLALFGNFAVVGPMTLAVMPLNMLLSLIMFRLSRQSFKEVGLRVRRNRIGFLAYLLVYQLFMSPVSVLGYGQELFRSQRRW